MTLQETLEKIELYTLGNRITLTNRMSFLTSFSSILIGAYTGNEMLTGLSAVWCAASTVPSACLEIVTKSGTTTPKYFKRTEESIKEHNKLDERFAQTLIEGTENRALVGYCQQQGMYLAAKKHGFKKEAKQYLKEYSKVKFPFF